MNLFSQIHDIIFNSKGAYEWNTIYEMPRWLRQFTFNKLQDFYTKENDRHIAQMNNASNNVSNLVDSQGRVDKQKASEVIVPDYVSKMVKK